MCLFEYAFVNLTKNPKCVFTSRVSCGRSWKHSFSSCAVHNYFLSKCMCDFKEAWRLHRHQKPIDKCWRGCRGKGKLVHCWWECKLVQPLWRIVSVWLILFTMPIVLVFTLFAEPRIGKAQAKRLEEDSRSHRKCRHIYSLLAGTAAITQPLSWLTQQP